MPCALFGKLIGKRDFIAVNTPRDLLLAWEGWMQASLASSKNGLQGDWLKAYLHAPLWRFWLGPEICGMPVKGVFMSSMDGVGRHFPLTVFSFVQNGDGFASPSDVCDQGWFEAAEDFLLATIDAGEDYEAVLAGFGALADGMAGVSALPDTCVIRHGAIIAVAAAGPPGGLVSGVPAEQQPLSDSADVGEGATAAPEPALAANFHEDVGNNAPETGSAATADPKTDMAADIEVLPETVSAMQTDAHLANAGEAVAEQTMSVSSADADVAPGPMRAAEHVVDASPATPSFGFAELRRFDGERADRRRSFWWTIGGHDVPAMAMMAEGMPDPQLMMVMLTGSALQPAS